MDPDLSSSQASTEDHRVLSVVSSWWSQQGKDAPMRDANQARQQVLDSADSLWLPEFKRKRWRSPNGSTPSEHEFRVNESDAPGLKLMLSKLEGLPEALTAATDVLVKETIRAQMQMKDIVKSLEEKISSQLDMQEKSIECMKVTVEDAYTEETNAADVAARPEWIRAVTLEKEIEDLGKDEDDFPNTPFPDVDVHATLASIRDATAEAIKAHIPLHLPNLDIDVSASMAIPRSRSYYPPHSKLLAFVHSDLFDTVAFAAIILNSLLLGYQTNHDINLVIDGKEVPNTSWMRWANVLLLSFFIAELSLRFAAERCWFFLGRDVLWNLFDAVMILSAIMDQISIDVGANISFLRLFRVCKVMRAIRILRVFRFFRDLRLMVYTILLSFKSLVWAFVLLGTLIYSMAILFCQGVAESYVSSVEEKVPELLKEYYGSLPAAMYSLVRAIAGGQDWFSLVQPLSSVSWFHATVFVIYTLFVIFGMLNVLTGVFCDRASELSSLDRDIVVEAERSKVEHFCRSLRHLFEEADSDKSGTISWQEFQEYSKQSDVRAFFATLELDISDAHELFLMLDSEDKGQVRIEDFIAGCLRIKGFAKSMDILHLQDDVLKVKKMIMVMSGQLNTVFEVLSLYHSQWHSVHTRVAQGGDTNQSKSQVRQVEC